MFRFLLWFVFYSFFCGFPGLVWGADDSSPSSIGILAAAGKALESVNENSHLYSDVFSIYEYERPVYLGRILPESIGIFSSRLYEDVIIHLFGDSFWEIFGFVVAVNGTSSHTGTN